MPSIMWRTTLIADLTKDTISYRQGHVKWIIPSTIWVNDVGSPQILNSAVKLNFITRIFPTDSLQFPSPPPSCMSRNRSCNLTRGKLQIAQNKTVMKQTRLSLCPTPTAQEYKAGFAHKNRMFQRKRKNDQTNPFRGDGSTTYNFAEPKTKPHWHTTEPKYMQIKPNREHSHSMDIKSCRVSTSSGARACSSSRAVA